MVIPENGCDISDLKPSPSYLNAFHRTMIAGDDKDGFAECRDIISAFRRPAPDEGGSGWQMKMYLRFDPGIFQNGFVDPGELLFNDQGTFLQLFRAVILMICLFNNPHLGTNCRDHQSLILNPGEAVLNFSLLFLNSELYMLFAIMKKQIVVYHDDGEDEDQGN